MASEPAAASVEAVVFDLDDVLVPFHTPRAFQWAWKPQGPLLGERRLQSALRRALHAWDRRRWLGVTGKAAPVDLAALREHLAAALAEVAGHPLPAAEVEAVVRRLLRPAGEVERFPEVVGVLAALRSAGRKVAVVTPLPAESARWLLKRAGLSEELLCATGDGPTPVLPAREAFRAAVERTGVAPGQALFVGDLFWSDVHAAERAGLRAVLIDRVQNWPHVREARITTLAGVEPWLAAAPGTLPEGRPAPAPPTGAPSSSDLL